MTENVKQGFYEFMSMQALTFKDPITLVGGAYVSTENFKASTQFASNIVAADGGANTCLQYGVKPDAVIGDLDSIEEKSKVQICLLYTSPSPRDGTKSRMPSSA